MTKEYLVYIEDVLSRIQAKPETKLQVRQSLTEHIEVMIEKYGTLAFQHLDSAEQVAKEFNDNLEDGQKLEPAETVGHAYWYGRRQIYRRVSKRKIFNMPLYHITNGYNPETERFEVARGFFAVGPVAFGVFAYGGAAFGVISFGGLGVGLLLTFGGIALSLGIALGGLAIGALLAMGGGAISFGIALGGFAMGHVAIGGGVVGKYIYDTNTGYGNAVEWFREYMPYFVRFFR